MRVRTLFTCAGSALAPLVLVALAGSAFAQAKYPSHPIRVIVPYTPGGITDVATRRNNARGIHEVPEERSGK
jgi:tripartite-type tricarboxylate transporter receptor subunit TctC